MRKKDLSVSIFSMHFVRRSFNLSALLGKDENCIALLWKNLQKIDKKQVEQNYIMMQWCIPGTFDFWILQFFIYNIYLCVISSDISITLLVEFPWLNHWIVLAFRMFSVFGFPYTCWISSITDLFVVEKFFSTAAAKENPILLKLDTFMSDEQTQEQSHGSCNQYISKTDFIDILSSDISDMLVDLSAPRVNL